MAIKLADTLAPMSEFPAAMAEHIGFSDGATLQEKFDNKELGGGDSSVTLTQEEYEALTEEEKLDGLYYTYDTKRIYKNGVQYGASEPIPLTMEEYKTLKEAGAIDEQQEYLVEADAEGILLEASDIGYSNAVSNLSCTTVQGAIDDNSGRIATLETDMAIKESVYITNDPSGSGILYNAANYLGVNSVDTYGIYNLVVTTDTGESGECNFIYKHRVATYGNIISENGVTFSNLNEYGTIVVDSTSANKTFKVKYLGEPTEDMSGLSKYEYTRANKNALVSDINPTIDRADLFPSNELDLNLLYNRCGTGVYDIVGQGSAGHGIIRADLWAINNGTICYIVSIMHSDGSSSTVGGNIDAQPTVPINSKWMSVINKLTKIGYL